MFPIFQPWPANGALFPFLLNHFTHCIEISEQELSSSPQRCACVRGFDQDGHFCSVFLYVLFHQKLAFTLCTCEGPHWRYMPWPFNWFLALKLLQRDSWPRLHSTISIYNPTLVAGSVSWQDKKVKLAAWQVQVLVYFSFFYTHTHTHTAHASTRCFLLLSWTQRVYSGWWVVQRELVV